jgi:hypothetical protein
VEPIYNQLTQKLDAFIRRFYLNQMIRGGLLLLTVLLGSWLLVSTTAFYGDLNSSWRGLLFYGFVVSNLSIIVYFLVVPWLRQRGLIKGISYRQAAEMIGNHFPEVRDKLINTLELHEFAHDPGSGELLLASIEQRTAQLQPVPFWQVIDLSANKKYLRYVMPVVLVFLAVLIGAPGIITEGGDRVLRYQTYFEPIAPFDFVSNVSDLVVEQAQDVEISLKTIGSEIPAEAYIEIQGKRYKMEQLKKGQFNYQLRNVKQRQKLRFIASKYNSVWYELKVVPKPVVARFEVELIYPVYLGKTNERLSNTGDLLVPVGTELRWLFAAEQVDELQLILSNGEFPNMEQEGKSRFKTKWRAMDAVDYVINVRNKLNPRVDSMVYTIQVIPDQYPVITAAEVADSAVQRIRYFSGEIGDDYGFTSLFFKYQRYDEQGKTVGNEVAENLNIGKFTRQGFYHFFDLRNLDLQDGESVNYFFEVSDNDAVMGPKKSRTEVFTYRTLTSAEKKETISANASDIQKKLEAAVKDARALQKEVDKLRRKLRENKELNWEDKRTLEQLQQKQEQLRNQLEDATQKMKENRDLRDDAKQEELLRKQEQIQEMAERLLNEELKRMMDELQKMMEQQTNKDQMQQKLDQIKLDEKDVERELDRMLEFFKQMEVEQKALEAADQLDKLAAKQEQLRQQMEKQGVEAPELKEKQEQLNKSFDDLANDLKDLDEKNKELNRPNDLGDLQKDANDISEQMDNAAKSMGQKQQKKAGEQQKQSAEKMKQMAKKMREEMQQQEMEALEENIQSLRMLLENLIKFSFNQEALMDRLQENSNYSPVYVEIGQDQFKLKEEAKLIEDSLVALGKRLMQLQHMVTKEVSALNDHLEKAVDHLGNRQTPQAKTRQQYAMTSANNMAVLLSELLKQMQEQKAQKMDGEQQCQKPGGGSQSRMSKMSQLQKSLNQQMKEMRDAMEGNKGEKPGGKEGKNKEMSQGFAEMVAKQEAIRRELQKLSQELNKDGKQSLGDLDQLAKEMEKTEKELVNKMLTKESMKRQQEILTRLLDAEKAEREREFDERRESKTAEEVKRDVPPGFEAYRRQKLKTLEMYRTVSPELNSFYKQKVDQYFLQLNR